MAFTTTPCTTLADVKNAIRYGRPCRLDPLGAGQK
jgi:hypothetical protein